MIREVTEVLNSAVIVEFLKILLTSENIMFF